MKRKSLLYGTLILSCSLLAACGKTDSAIEDVEAPVVILDINPYIEANNADKGGQEVKTSQDGIFTYCNNAIEGITILSDKTNHSSEYIIPATIDGLTVTKIGNSVYKDRGFTKVVIPESVKIIDDMAFMGCNNLTEAVMGANLVEIRECAFQNCYQLKQVTLNDGLFRLGKSAFSACYNLESINLPDSIVKIDSYCFTNSGLKSVAIPKNLVIISPGVFMGCSDLKSVSTSGPIYMFEDNAFKDCVNLSIKVDETCEKACLTAFENVKSVEIDEGIYYFPEELKYDGDFSEFENPDVIKYYYEELETDK